VGGAAGRRACRPHADDPQYARRAQLRAGRGARPRRHRPGRAHAAAAARRRPGAGRRRHHERDAEAGHARGERVVARRACRRARRAGGAGLAAGAAGPPAGRRAVGAERGRERDLDPHAQRAVRACGQQRRLAAGQQRRAAAGVLLACAAGLSEAGQRDRVYRRRR